MKFVPMHELLVPAWKAGYAVPAFCTWNAEVAETALQVASDLRAPVILMAGPGEFPLLSPRRLAGIVRTLAADFNVPAALHLDHGDSPALVNECIEAGFTSVMLDYSTRPFDENAEALREVVAMARPRGVTVEGEIGAVGRVDDSTTEGSVDSTLTHPDEAARYAELTGVDCLAVSIGNAHGIYTRLPVFDFERLERIRRAVPVPLVLHGGSGTDPDHLRRSVSLGMAKINVASELCKAYRDAYAQGTAEANPGWLPTVLSGTKPAMARVMERWFHLTGAAGKA